MQLLYYIALFIIFGIYHMQDHAMVLTKVTLLKSFTKQVKAPILVYYVTDHIFQPVQ